MGICNSNDNHPTLGGFAIASPIPALEPVTKGTLPLKFETTPKNIAHVHACTCGIMSKWRRIRIHLEFPSIDIHCQKCWFLFDSDSCRLVSDLTYLISKRFGLKSHHNLLLLLDEFVLPSSESIHIIRDNDVIKVVSNELDEPKLAIHNSIPYDESNGVHAHRRLHKKNKRCKEVKSDITPITIEAETSKMTATSVNTGNIGTTSVNTGNTSTTSINTGTTSVNTGNTSTTSINTGTTSVNTGNTSTTSINTTTTVNGGTHIRFESIGSEDDSSESISTIQKQIVSHPSLPERCIPFNQLPDPPKIGDKIRYKVLELSDSYTPNVSHYKLGIIKSFSLSTQNLIIQLSDETVKLELQRRESHSLGKFSISQELCNDIETCIEINLSDMIEPTIIT